MITLLLLTLLTTPQNNDARLLASIGMVESSHRENAYNRSTDAVGFYQIRPIYVQDVNRILGHEHYSLADRWDGQKSTEMVIIYFRHYGRGMSYRELAALHYAGPRGAELLKTSKQVQIYVNKVMSYYQTGQQQHRPDPK